MIAQMVTGEKIADIGTDHGYIPVHLCLTGVCKKAVASDVRPGPLLCAQKTIEKYQMQGCVTTHLYDGIDDEKCQDVDVIIIAGMGGEAISAILAKSALVKKDGICLVLQPMTAQEELRVYLRENGFSIIQERLCREGRKIYVCFLVCPGETALKDPIYNIVGESLLQEGNELAGEYITQKIAPRKKRLQGLLKSRDLVEEEAVLALKAEVTRLEELYEEVEKRWQK